ncbi:hypothetical protein KAW18_05255 [candidate division WOR-3 bacterium]|nr:hypothetical protein [candidate division WOR-3 bacterium]
MSLESSFENILKLKEVEGFALVSGEDGSIIKSGGITPGNIDEIVAFIGSAAEIITEACGVEEIKSIKGVGMRNVVIIPYEDKFIGFVLGENRCGVENDIINLLIQEEIKGDSRVYKLLVAKVSQLNKLLEEFAKDSDESMWHNYINKGLGVLDKEKKFTELINLNNVRLEVFGAKGLIGEDVNRFMKLLLDFVVKKAISEFGNDEARKRVHAVIKSIGKKDG